jgi:SNF2 family DNA or RNA helicase
VRTYGTLKLVERVQRVEKTKWSQITRDFFESIDEPKKGLWWQAEVEPHVAIRLKRMFGRIGGQFGEIRIKDSEEMCRELQWFVDRFPLEIPDAHRQWLDDQSAKYQARMGTFTRLLSGELEPSRFEMALPPRKYQRVAADLLIRSQGLLVADDLGVGKTVTAIAALTDPRTRPALVVTLTHLPGQWRRELQKFAPQLRTHVLTRGKAYDIVEKMTRQKYGRTKKKHRLPKGSQLDLVDPTEPFPDVIITNYHKLAGWAETLAPRIKSVIYDECQELRRSESQKYNAARHLSDNANFRCGLSATPIYNFGGEMFNVLECIRPGALGTWREFSEEWCTHSVQRDKAVVKEPKAFGTYLREQGLMIRRTRKDVARELPDMVRVTQDLPYDSKPIDKMKGAVAELAKIILGKAEFAVKGRAARELDWKLRQATGIAKAPYVADFVRMLVEQGEKVVLYGWHREVYSIWQKKLSDLNPVMYTGSESVRQKEQAVQSFCEDESNVLIISLRSGAGLDGLQHHTRTLVFGELDWSPGIHEQCEGRVHRDMQKEAVVAYYMLADGGSDPIIADVLGVKDVQIRGVRDPNADVMEKQSDDDRIQRLARSYLEGQGIDVSSLDEA